MIELLIYHLHIVGVLFAFTIRWQREGLKGAFLALALCGLAFTILWALMGPIAVLIMPGEAKPGALVSSDTISLLLTMAAEIPLYWVIFFRQALAQNR